MDQDEVQPKTAKGIVLDEDLKKLSVAELESRIAALEREISRVRAELAAKRAHAEAAATIFKR